MVRKVLALAVALGAACGDAARKREPERASPPPAAEAVRKPLRQGFTQQPPAEALQLPAPAPLLGPEELEAAREKTPTGEALRAAQKEIRELMEQFERNPEASRVERIRAAAVRHAREGRVYLGSAPELHQEYEFPNEAPRIDRKYKDRVVVLTGTVVPPNVPDITDVYKIFEQEPYVHDPLLLQTAYDVTFVRCRLSHPSVQKLADWQSIQVVGIVEGKEGSDVVIGRCVVLR